MSHSATRSSPVGPGVQTSASCSVVGKLWHQKVPGDRPCLPSSLSLVAPSEGWVGSSVHTWNLSPSSGRRWPLCTAHPCPWSCWPRVACPVLPGAQVRPPRLQFMQVPIRHGHICRGPGYTETHRVTFGLPAHPSLLCPEARAGPCPPAYPAARCRPTALIPSQRASGAPRAPRAPQRESQHQAQP